MLAIKPKVVRLLGCKPREPQHSGLIDCEDEDGNQLDDDNNDND